LSNPVGVKQWLTHKHDGMTWRTHVRYQLSQWARCCDTLCASKLLNRATATCSAQRTAELAIW
jgi:hypothetical protein